MPTKLTKVCFSRKIPLGLLRSVRVSSTKLGCLFSLSVKSLAFSRRVVIFAYFLLSYHGQHIKLYGSYFHSCYLNEKTENSTFVRFFITIFEKREGLQPLIAQWLRGLWLQIRPAAGLSISKSDARY